MDTLFVAAGFAGRPVVGHDRRGPQAASPRWRRDARGLCRSDGTDHGSSDWRCSMTPERKAAGVVRWAHPGTITVLHDRGHSRSRVQADSTPLMRLVVIIEGFRKREYRALGRGQYLVDEYVELIQRYVKDVEHMRRYLRQSGRTSTRTIESYKIMRILLIDF